jgi:hypothetical protein
MEKVLKGEKLEGKLLASPTAPLKLPEALQVPSLNPTGTEQPPTAAD